MINRCLIKTTLWLILGFLGTNAELWCLPRESAVKGLKTPEIKVDARVELLGIIFRLAGNPEYNQGRVPAYEKDVQKQFASFSDHPVVRLARDLRKRRGISYDAVMSLALHLKDPFTLVEEIPFEPRPAALEQRWTVPEARAFLKNARDFVRESDFSGFVKRHQELYREAVSRMQSLMDRHEVVGWFDRFFGTSADARFTIVLGMLNGGGSYGPKVVYPDGREELFTILGVWLTDDAGLPQFDTRVLGTVVHEFCHSFVNPLVNRHSSELKGAGEHLFPLVEPAMRRQAYSDWKTMMAESLVRASVVRWELEKNGRASAEQRIAGEEKNQFFWIRSLSERLGEYDNQRSIYPDMEAFFTRIQSYFNDYARNARDSIANIKDGWEKEKQALAARAPKIVSLSPGDGARDVDPALEAIRITFDRPMKDKAWGVMRRDGNMPRLNGEVFYDSTRTVFTIPVHLDALTDYTIGLNSENALAFQDEKGNPLVPVTFRFRTGSRR